MGDADLAVGCEAGGDPVADRCPVTFAAERDNMSPFIVLSDQVGEDRIAEELLGEAAMLDPSHPLKIEKCGRVGWVEVEPVVLLLGALRGLDAVREFCLDEDPAP